MSPLDWLRAKAKQKPKYATGGLVAAPTPGDTPPAIISRDCVWPITALATAAAVTPPRDIPWANPMQQRTPETACSTCDPVLYSRCLHSKP